MTPAAADALIRELPRLATGLLAGVLRASWQACVLAALVLFLQRVLGRRLSAGARYNLWLLVILRLALPVTPASRFSLFNLAAWAEARAAAAIAGRAADPQATAWPGPNPPRASAAPVGDAQPPPEGAAPTPPPGGRSPADVAEADAELAAPDHTTVADPAEAPVETDTVASAADIGAATMAAPTAAPAPPTAVAPRPAQPPPVAIAHAAVPVARSAPSWRDSITPANAWAAAALIWLAGVLFSTWRIVRATRAFGAVVRRMRPVNDPIVLALADGCRRDLGLARCPPMLEGMQVQSPALVGWRRPVLLLPDGIASRLDSRELRLVLLHELAHCKRRDVAANWLLVAVGTVHWFNPLVRLLMRRVRADRELACDEAVLAAAGGQQDRRAYGRVLLKLLESLARSVHQGFSAELSTLSPAAAHGASRAAVGMIGPAGLPGGAVAVVGILERDARHNLIRRIIMISQFDPAMSHRRRRWSAAVTVAALVLGGVALTDAVRGAAPAQPPATTSPDGASQPPATQTEVSRIPILSDLPIVGRLFVKTVVAPAATESPSAPPLAPGETSPRDTPTEGTPTTPPPVGAGGPPSAPVTAPPLAETTVEAAPPSSPGDVTVAAAGTSDGPGISAQKIRAVVEAKLHRAKAAVAIAQEQARMKQQQAARLSELDKQHAVSHEEVERAKSEAEVARLQVEQAEADLEQAAASLQAAIAGQHQAEASARGAAPALAAGAPAATPPIQPPPAGAPAPGMVPGMGGYGPRGGPYVPGPGQPPGMMGGYPGMPAPAGGGMAGGPMMPPGGPQGRLALRAYDIADLVGDSPNSANQANQLVNLITQMVGPDQWNTGSGATLGVFRTKLIVKASDSAQKEIVELLDMLRHGDGDDNARPAPTPRRNPGPGRDRGNNRAPSAAPRGAGGPAAPGTPGAGADAPAIEEPTPPAAPGSALELPPGHPPIPVEPSGRDEKPKVP